jgi:hypothetical protein
MTEAEWRTADDWNRMMQFIGRWARERQWRLFAAACCRRIWHLIRDEQSRRAVEVSERYVDRAASSKELRVAVRDAREAAEELYRAAYPEDIFDTRRNRPSWYAPKRELLAALYAAGAALYASGGVAENVSLGLLPRGDDPGDLSGPIEVPSCAVKAASAANRWSEADRKAEDDAICELLRDLVNPFQTRALDRAWRTADAVAIARAIYDDRAFDRMPILGDALEEAGCGDARILEHCRAPRVHVRGCWVVDAVLGRV